MLTATVTIAIASYNNAPYIERCINSVIQQSYPNLEILIVDDGSKDDTQTRIERYKKDKRVRILTKENGGLSSVRQMGLENAKGEYVSFIDADDYLAPNYVEKMLNKLVADGSDICLCSTRFEDMEGNYLPKESTLMSCVDSRQPVHLTTNILKDPKEKISAKLFLSDSWNKMYRTAFLRESGVVFNMPRGLNGTDTVFNRKLALHQPKYSTISDECYIHVIYKKSAVHRKNKDLQSSFNFITKELLKETEKLGIGAIMKVQLENYYYKGLFSSYYDVYNESLNGRDIYHRFKKLRKSHQVFVTDNRISTFPLKVIKSQALRAFVLCHSVSIVVTILYFSLFSRLFK